MGVINGLQSHVLYLTQVHYTEISPIQASDNNCDAKLVLVINIFFFSSFSFSFFLVSSRQYCYVIDTSKRYFINCSEEEKRKDSSILFSLWHLLSGAHLHKTESVR